MAVYKTCIAHHSNITCVCTVGRAVCSNWKPSRFKKKADLRTYYTSHFYSNLYIYIQSERESVCLIRGLCLSAAVGRDQITLTSMKSMANFGNCLCEADLFSVFFFWLISSGTGRDCMISNISPDTGDMVPTWIRSLIQSPSYSNCDCGSQYRLRPFFWLRTNQPL